MKHRLTLSELSARIEAEIREHFKQMREYPSLVWVGREVLPWSMRPRSFKLDSGREIPIQRWPRGIYAGRRPVREQRPQLRVLRG